MSTHKVRRGDNSPSVVAPANSRQYRLNFEVTASKLECFIKPKTIRQRASRPKKLKSVSLTERREDSSCRLHESREKDSQLEPINLKQFIRETAPQPQVSKPVSQQVHSPIQHPRAVGQSPDLADTIMNEVLRRIETEGISSEWAEDCTKKHQQSGHSSDEKQHPSAEVSRIWDRHHSLATISEVEKSAISTEGTKLSSNSIPLLNSYFVQPTDNMYYSQMPPQYFHEGYSYEQQPYQLPPTILPVEELNTRRPYDITYTNILRDGRTTIMIKNIPNKYSLKLLCDEIDESHADLYDFLYLPFDFNNNCNVGYAFINFATPSHLQSFYEEFHNKKWLRFRSQKICVLTYARLQGRQSLIEHFHNSKVLNQKDKKFRPIIRNLGGLNALLEKQRSGR